MSEQVDSQNVLNQIVLEFMQEQKRKRRYRLFVRSIVVLILLLFIYQTFKEVAPESMVAKDHIGLIDINGEIADGDAVNSDDFAKGLDVAYKSKGMKALILRINSPGGSPVQADYMYHMVTYYRNKYKNIPVYAVCVDMCASAAYYVAASANEIYANPSSMVGSIGVLFNGFGFVDTMQKLGVSRRLYTAGTNKGFLDPFSPVEASQVQIIQNMLDSIHQTFIQRVREGRGSRLRENNEIFSGLFWTGMQAKELGLIDGFASAGQLAREKIKIDSVVDYTVKKSMFDRFAKSMHSLVIGPYGQLTDATQSIKLR